MLFLAFVDLVGGKVVLLGEHQHQPTAELVEMVGVQAQQQVGHEVDVELGRIVAAADHDEDLIQQILTFGVHDHQQIVILRFNAALKNFVDKRGRRSNGRFFGQHERIGCKVEHALQVGVLLVAVLTVDGRYFAHHQMGVREEILEQRALLLGVLTAVGHGLIADSLVALVEDRL